ncbi:hypothetical protein F0U44_12125 [Nocardioides humilatus]|uniref:Uncharacterized protein n=1 Tax=Nocardioides humilatus TaxID=2607660 RepID=A0A5B1LEY0_9ACTN|nr:hypothetical protein [Nocardioides humilatus]KAA1419192.1 hypothetical protein F0U44_12125 [Nocardioides humilatus]
MKDLRTGDALTRAQLLKFNPLWDSRDRGVIAEDIDTFGGMAFQYYEAGYNRGVNVLNAAEEVLFSVSPGTIYYGGGRSRPGSVYLGSHGGHVYRTSRAGSGGGKPPQATGDVCTRCFQQMSLTGECANCD